MNLYRETGSFVSWYGAVLSTFVRAKPVTTVTLVLCSAGSKLANMLARLLPLKAILLAGSNGVPSYFRPFLAPDHKQLGLVVLIAAALVCYVADPVLEAAANKLSAKGSWKVVENANVIVLTEQRLKARDTYISVTGMTAELLFAVLFFGVVLHINPRLFALLVSIFLTAFALTAWLLRGNPHETRGGLPIFITENLGSYLNTLSVLTFAIAFLFVILPFVTGTTFNILLAMVAITFLRRTLRSLTFSIRAAVKLTRKSHQLNALLFRHHRSLHRERPELRTLRAMLASQRRQRRTERELFGTGGKMTSMQTQWLDPSAGVQRLIVDVAFEAGGQARYLQRVFPPHSISRLDNEEFLFRHASRSSLLAPCVAAQFELAAFECRMDDLGCSTVPVPDQAWKQLHTRVIETLWSYQPHEKLVAAYLTSNAPLQDRLTSEFVGRAFVAVSGEREKHIYRSLLERLPALHAELSSFPLFIWNPGLSRANVMLADDGEPVLTDWGDWSIQPLGAGRLPLRGRPDALDTMIARVRVARADIPLQYSARDLLVAANCANLERAIERGMYRTAIKIATAIVNDSYAEDEMQQIDGEEQEVELEEQDIT